MEKSELLLIEWALREVLEFTQGNKEAIEDLLNKIVKEYL